MHGDELAVVALLVSAAGLLVAAVHTRIPYPILLVVGSALLGFAPGAPDVEVDPDVILVLALPPLLYTAAFFTDLHDFRRNIRPIGLLAVGLVVFTTVVVGVVAHAALGLDWAVAFTLGAIVSPTDPVAATAIAGRLGAPRRYVSVVEGESLVNDATGLIAFKFAVAAVVSGTFSLLDAGAEFVLTAAGGIALGIAVGIAVAAVRRRLEDAPTEITISFLTPYLAYLPAEAIGVSAVLAAVTSGIYLGWLAPQLISPQTRIETYAFWRVVSFLINSALFVLIGLQLPAILDDLSGVSAGELALDSVVVVLTVLLVRFAWIFPSTYVPRRLFPRWYSSDPWPPMGLTLLVAWTGMRGAVSLAAALAIPETVDGGGAFPDRALVVFLVYVVILATLLLQGLTLPSLIERLGLGAEEGEERREALARIRAAEAAIERLDELAGEDWVREPSRVRMRGLYQFRVRRFGARFDDDDDGVLEEGSQAYQRLRREALQAERDELLRLRGDGRISDEVMRRIERDLDLEDVRLDI